MDNLKYKYQTVFIHNDGIFADKPERAAVKLDAALNRMAEEGWEYVNSIPVPNPMVVLFILVFRKPATTQ